MEEWADVPPVSCGQCVADSTRDLSSNDLWVIRTTSEMEEWVWPQNKMGPLVTSVHNYTRIQVDSVLHELDSPGPVVLFLSIGEYWRTPPDCSHSEVL